MSYLGACPLFARLLESELRQLEAAAVVREFPAGARLFQEGDPGDGLYVILEGQVQISCLVSPTDRRDLSRFGPGDFFGEMAVIDTQARSATATSLEPLRVVFLAADRVRAVLAQSPTLSANLIREGVHRLREFNQTFTREVVQAERLALVGRFARSIVHDFKNPLNIIGISADMAAQETATLETRTAARTRIRRQIERLSNMITELLEFTRGNATAVVLAKLDYAAFLAPVLEELGHEIEARGVRLACATPLPSVMVAMDPRRLTHVFHNLVNNACDAMPDGGTVHVSFEVTPAEVVTSLRDTGNGIAPEVAGRLFEAFVTYGKASGTGLGLSICRRIVEDHRGIITARNASEGGAVFSFTLPVATGD